MKFVRIACLIALGGVHVTRAQGLDSSALLAARLHVLALRASLPPGVKMDQDKVVIHSRSRTASEAEAAEILARMPKPLRCRAVVDAEVLSIECDVLSAGDSAMVHSRRVRDLDGEKSGRPLIDVGPILVEGGGRTLTVEVAVFREWYRDYYLPDLVSVSVFDATTDELARGLKARIVISRTGEVDRDAFPAELKGIFDAMRRETDAGGR